MMLTVSARTLRQAQTVVEDRVERAAQELQQHDVAMQAMQAWASNGVALCVVERSGQQF